MDFYKELSLPRIRVMQRPASLGKRTASFVLDLLLLRFIILAPLVSFTDRIGVLWIIALLVLAYFTLFEYLLGQTPGMRIMNINAGELKLRQALVRNLPFFPVLPFPFLLLLELAYLLTRGKRFTERLSKTATTEEVTV